MKTILCLLLLSISFFASAQENAIDKYFGAFQKQHALETTAVSSKMFNIYFNEKAGSEKEEFAVILKKLTGLRILNRYQPKNGTELFKEASALMPVSYETILSLNDTDRIAKFYTKEDKAGKITELVMIAYQWGRFLTVSVTGDINLSDILKLSQNLTL